VATRAFEEVKGAFAVRAVNWNIARNRIPNERIRRATNTSRRENPSFPIPFFATNPPVPGSDAPQRGPGAGAGSCATVTVKRAVVSPPEPSDTMTVNGTFPVFPGEVSQRTTPVLWLMVIPAGASFRE